MEKYTIEDIVDIINTEDLGYAIMSYTDGENIEDETLRKLWKTASNAMIELQEYIETQMGEGFKWD